MTARPQIAEQQTAMPPRLVAVRGPNAATRARGEPMLWLCGGALAICLFMVLGLLLLVAYQGGATFWPRDCVEVRLLDGTARLGEPTRRETYRPNASQIGALPAQHQAVVGDRLTAADGMAERRQLRTGNFDLTDSHYHWVSDFEIASESLPHWAMVIERQAWGRFYGYPVAYVVDGEAVASEPGAVFAAYEAGHASARERFRQIEHLRKHGVGGLADRESAARLRARAAELEHGGDSDEFLSATRAHAELELQNAVERAAFEAEIERLLVENARTVLRMRTADRFETNLQLADIVRAYTPNRLGPLDRVGIYLDRWAEFLFDDPREANTEGGVWPAIFGTVLMTLLMSLAVVPLGVLAALYMREYAKGGLVISAVRIAVNNLAGVPSIVFGVFGLGFFCYIVGGTIDAIFYAEHLPSPTFAQGGLLWASLTLALLTLPVVIVATEEALAAVPGSMREGSYACGASKWQTIRRIVLPRAMPGIMTGMILAMARGAGEVAPLMLVGAGKMASELPLDTEAPYLHPSRGFMHLGFHIFDVGFQSQNSEAARPLVYTTTLLLIAVITVLNLFAIWLRSRMRRRFVGNQF